MDNKTKIMNASLKLFATKGFHGTSTAKIVEASGVSNGSLFYYFKSKEELINTLYITNKEKYKDYILSCVDELTPTKKTIKQLWNWCVNWQFQNQECVEFFTIYSNSPYIDTISKEEATRNFDFVSNVIEGLKDEGLIVNLHLEILENTFYASALAAYRFLLNHPDENKEVIFDLWWRSVAKDD